MKKATFILPLLVISLLFTSCSISTMKKSEAKIIDVSAGISHTVGLREDGTAIAIGDNADGQCDIESWNDLIAIDTAGRHTVGLKSDGTVVAVGRQDFGKCNVSDWTDIVAIVADIPTVGLKSDGTVVATGSNVYGECNVENW